MTLVELGDILPSSSVMIVSVTGSTTSGQPLSETQLIEVNQLCAEVLQLDAAKIAMLQYVESCMTSIAPNTSALIGSRIAAQVNR